MGLTTVVARVGKGKRSQRLRLLVDSGASFSLLPEKVWKRLRLKPLDRVTLVLANGTEIERPLSEVWFEYRGAGRTSPGILGTGGDEALLGAVTLETMGLMLNPLSRELLPMKLKLARQGGQ